MKITIIAVGKIRESYLRDALAEYSKRLGKYVHLSIVEVPDEKVPEHASDAEEDLIRKKEGDRILSKLCRDAYVIALDMHGQALSSEELAGKIEGIGLQGTSHIQFLIGGSIGLDPRVKEAADFILSFSKMTFPHPLMRLILLEQIYRSYKIIHHEPYHK